MEIQSQTYQPLRCITSDVGTCPMKSLLADLILAADVQAIDSTCPRLSADRHTAGALFMLDGWREALCICEHCRRYYSAHSLGTIVTTQRCISSK